MKKVFKRAIPFVLVVVMCLSMGVPAFATMTIREGISDFASQGNGSSGGLVRLIQTFLYCYNDTTQACIAKYGGVDGAFGDGTEEAVIAFQRARGFTDDGVFGQQSWPWVATNLTLMENSRSYYYYSFYSNVYGWNKMLEVYSADGNATSSTKWWLYDNYNTSNGYVRFTPTYRSS